MNTLENKTILITGGAGFIGSTLAQKFVEHNKVRIFDNFDRDTLSKTNLATHQNIEIIKGNILDKESCL